MIHLLEFIHWVDFGSLAGWLGLEPARLLGEWVDLSASNVCLLLLQLHVEDTTEIELAVLRQLSSGQLKITGLHGADFHGLELHRLCDLCISLACGEARCTSLLRGTLHGWGHGVDESRDNEM